MEVALCGPAETLAALRQDGLQMEWRRSIRSDKNLPIVLVCCRRRSERHSRNLLHVAAISVRRAGGAAFVRPRSSQGVSLIAVGLSKAMHACHGLL